jgi:hypothetical protein
MPGLQGAGDSFHAAHFERQLAAFDFKFATVRARPVAAGRQRGVKA